MNKRPIILTLVGTYFPGYKGGGPVRSIANLVDHLSDEFDFWIVTRDRDLGDASPYPHVQGNQWQRVGKAMVRYLPPENRTIAAMARLINDSQHDVMYLNSFFEPTFTIKPLLARRLGWLPNRPVIIAPRGEFSPGAIKIKSLKKRTYIQIAKLFRLYDNVTWQASSDYESRDIVAVMNPSPTAIHVATNLPGRLDSNERLDASVQPKAADADVKIVFLSRISPKKNLDYALRILSRVKASVVFDIFGPAEDAAYWKQCVQLIKQLPDNVSVNYFGSVPSDQVASIIGRYDLLLFPTRGENYGHVIAEALSVGTPVLLSDQTPWRNLEADRMGWDVSLGDADRFVGVIAELSAMPQKERDDRRVHIKRQTAHRLTDQRIFLANRELFRRAA
jgi:glycosyltransferase involved in cell wall biosynthesis